ncbi:leucine-rich repeat serine/threonine-protein kinase 1-like [Tubulanus polymorphus]|uniref:leucine-rich repeat serine/threonine-protein kinase 1-like n=1 Tax=Tubulanus polymorphus TaxID=672921 RepID=UPI003DA35635
MAEMDGSSDPSSFDPDVFKEILDGISDAIETNDCTTVKCLLDANKDLISFVLNPGESQRFFLHEACKKGFEDIVLILLNYGAYLCMEVSSDEGTPLKLACENGHQNIVHYLLEEGAKLHDPVISETSPIHAAVMNGHKNVIETIIEANRPVSITGFPNINVILYGACLFGHIDIVEMLLNYNIDLNAILPVNRIPFADICNMKNFTALYAALSAEHIDIATMLLKKGAELNQLLVNDHVEACGQLLRRFIEFSGPENSRSGYLNWRNLRMNIQTIPRIWLENSLDNLVKVNLSEIKFQQLPSWLPWEMPFLDECDVSSNGLSIIEAPTEILCKNLKFLNLARNKLSTLPIEIFQLPNLEVLNLSYNSLSHLHNAPLNSANLYSLTNTLMDTMFDMSSSFDACESTQRTSYVAQWNCGNLQVLDVSQNRLSELPPEICQATSLIKLDASHNLLTEFPKPWNCQLESLNLSGNMLKYFVKNIDMFWSSSLKILRLNRNQITQIPESVCRLVNLQDLQLAHNSLDQLPQDDWWQVKKLEKLDLRGNCLGDPEKYEDTRRNEMQGRLPKLLKNALKRKTKAQEKVREHKLLSLPLALRRTLTYISLQNNYLYEVPDVLFDMINIEKIDLRENVIRSLPKELGKLPVKCHLLVDEEAIDPSLLSTLGSEDVHSMKVSKILMENLKAQLRDSRPFYRMKLVIVGKERRGKTTLLKVLSAKDKTSRTDFYQQLSTTTVGVDINDLVLPAPKPDGPSIQFSCWDMAGQSEYYVTHQCFLSSNALYLVVWNLTLQMEGVENIRTWLLNIQARAPDSCVIIVGTYLDKLDPSRREIIIQKLTDAIYEKYGRPGYPQIRGFVCVSCLTKENIDMLKSTIYNVTESITDVKNRSVKLFGRLVPHSYLQLERIILNKREQMIRNEIPPVLLAVEFDQLIEKIPTDVNDIVSDEEVANAVRFLHEIGLILHFNDQQRALNVLYFIDPSWLCKVLANVINVKSIVRHMNNGMIRISDFEACLMQSGENMLFAGLGKKYIHILERFDIALQIDGNRLFIPSKLSENRFGYDRNEEYSPGEIMYRWYQMSYIPSGFWSRLISRLLVGVHLKLHQKIETDDIPVPQPQSTLGKQTFLAREWSLRRRTSTLFSNRLRRNTGIQNFIETDTDQMFFWQKGIMVCYSGGHFIVESSSDHFSANLDENQGLLISVFSKEHDFSPLGFLADQIDTLVLEWFPGLMGFGRGKPLTQRIIPCPICISQQPDPQMVQVITQVPCFTYEACAIALSDGETHMKCIQKQSIPLRELIPDLTMADLPSKLHLDQSQLILDPSKHKLLGQGGAANVYKALYKQKHVAVKLLHCSENVRQTGSSNSSQESQDSHKAEQMRNSRKSHRLDSLGLDFTVEERGLKIISSLRALRQEVTLMARLHHPLVISLIAAGIQPSCLMIEYAPLGSLRSVLEQKVFEQRGTEFAQKQGLQTYSSVLSPLLTHKIALQVGFALKYLHDSNIIYRDLKAQNVLVFNLDENKPINVKLSDYGISRFSTPQGIIGNDGTAGFIAPEIETGVAHDQQVDIFSFAMFLYELMSGYAPYQQYHHPVEVNKAVKRGERPQLKDVSVDTQFPFMEKLMRDCWLTRPDERPSAETIIKKMKEPQFLALKRVKPMDDEPVLRNVNCLYAGNRNQLLWMFGGQGRGRMYHCLNIRRGGFLQQNQPIPGPKLTFAARIENTLWLGNQSHEIEVYSYPKVGMLERIERFSLDAVPMSIYHEISTGQEPDRESFIYGHQEFNQRIYIGTSNGYVVIYGTKNAHEENTSTSSSSRDNDQFYESFYKGKKVRFEWQLISKVYILTHETVCSSSEVKCMEHVLDQYEIWVSAGNMITVLSTKTSKIEGKRIYLDAQAQIESLKSLDDRVWCMQKDATRILQFSASSRQLTRVFHCDTDIINTVIAESLMTSTFSAADAEADAADSSIDSISTLESTLKSDTSDDVESSILDDIEHDTTEESLADVFLRSLHKSPLVVKEDGDGSQNDKETLKKVAQMIVRETDENKSFESVSTVYNSTSHTLPNPQAEYTSYGKTRASTISGDRDNSLDHSFARKHASTVSGDGDVSRVHAFVRTHPNLEHTPSITARNIVTSVVVVKDTLWISKKNGKIIVVNIGDNADYGCIMGVLHSNAHSLTRGVIKQLIPVGDRYIVAQKSCNMSKQDTDSLEHYQLYVWQANDCKGIKDLHKFFQELRSEEIKFKDEERKKYV